MDNWWRVEVTDGNGLIVAIESECLAGRDIGDIETNTIKKAIDNLCGFIGLPQPTEAISALTADAGMERAAEMLDAAEAYYRTPDEGETDEEIKLNEYAAEALRVQAMIIRTNAIRAASAQVNADDAVMCELCNGPVSPKGHDCGPSAPDAGQVVVPVELYNELMEWFDKPMIKHDQGLPQRFALLRAAGSRHDG